MTDLFNADAAVLYIMGQSNAHAHDQTLSVQERITVPLKNVYTLNRTYNQSFDNDHVEWSHFTSASYNLGETQDHTASLAYYTASAWQTAVDEGKQLPDLYIVQISIGAEGLFAGNDNGLSGMWSMEKPKKLKPGVLLEADIALFPFALHTVKLVHEDLSGRFHNLCMLGLHWIGSEQDTLENVWQIPNFDETYDRFFDEILRAAGNDTPLVLYKLVCSRRQTVSRQGMDAVNAVFTRQCRRYPSAYMVNAADCPFYDPADPFLGIFAQDHVHYLAGTQHWFSRILLKRYGIID